MTDTRPPHKPDGSARSVPNLAVAVLAICAVVTTSLVVRREMFPTAAAGDLSAAPTFTSWQMYANAGHRRGPADAKVVVTTFSDFQCPYCRVLAARLDTLRAEFGDQVALVHRHLPLRVHPAAVDAARASECAAEQDRFWEFHDALFARQDAIGTDGWRSFASAAGISNEDAFARCVADRVDFPGLHRDTMAAQQLALSGTPASLINGRFVQGAQPLGVFRDAIRRELRDASR